MVNWNFVLPPSTVPTQPSEGNVQLLGICVIVLLTFLIPFSYFLLHYHSLLDVLAWIIHHASFFPHSESFQFLAVFVGIVAAATLLFVIALVISVYCLYQRRKYDDSMKLLIDQNLLHSFYFLTENTSIQILMEFKAAKITQIKAVHRFTSRSSRAWNENVNMSM